MPSVYSATASPPPRFPGSALSQPVLDGLVAREGLTASLERHAARDAETDAPTRFTRTLARVSDQLGDNVALLLSAAREPLRADIADVASAATSARLLLVWLTKVVFAIEHPAIETEVITSIGQLALRARWAAADTSAAAEAHFAAGVALRAVRGPGPAAETSKWIDSAPGTLLVRLGRTDRPVRHARPSPAALASVVAALRTEVEAWHATENKLLMTLSACASCLLSTWPPLPLPDRLAAMLVGRAGATHVAIRVREGGRERIAAVAGDSLPGDEVVALRDGRRVRGSFEVRGEPAAEVVRTMAPAFVALLDRSQPEQGCEQAARLGKVALAVARDVANGHTAKQIAQQYDKSESWVRRQLRDTYRALGIRSRVELPPTSASGRSTSPLRPTARDHPSWPMLGVSWARSLCSRQLREPTRWRLARRSARHAWPAGRRRAKRSRLQPRRQTSRRCEERCASWSGRRRRRTKRRSPVRDRPRW